jgi:hypothetical protein
MVKQALPQGNSRTQTPPKLSPMWTRHFAAGYRYEERPGNAFSRQPKRQETPNFRIASLASLNAASLDTKTVEMFGTFSAV